MSWLLGLVPAGGLALLMFAPKVLEILLVLAKAALEGFVEYLKAIWYGLTTANYGTVTLGVTLFILGFMFKDCPTIPAKYEKPSISKGITTVPSTKGTVNETFCHWFGC